MEETKKSKREEFNEDPEGYKQKFAERTEQIEAEMQLADHELEALEALVTGVGKAELEYGTAEIHDKDGGVLWTVKVKATLDGEQEQIYAKLQSEALKEASGKGGDIERFIVNMAKFIASVFPDDNEQGLSNEEFWIEFHRRSGLEKMLPILEDIMGPYNARMKKIQKFRPERTRKNTRNNL